MKEQENSSQLLESLVYSYINRKRENNMSVSSIDNFNTSAISVSEFNRFKERIVETMNDMITEYNMEDDICEEARKEFCNRLGLEYVSLYRDCEIVITISGRFRNDKYGDPQISIDLDGAVNKITDQLAYDAEDAEVDAYIDYQ